MAFVSAMSAQSAMKTGVNGEVVFTETGVGDLRVALFTMLSRDLSDSYIRDQITKIANSDDVNDEIIRDMFVMAFQTRDIRGGKGERNLFHTMFLNLYKHWPTQCLRLIPLIPEYGCWRDMWEFIERDSREAPEIVKTILSHTRVVFEKDLAHMKEGNPSSMSLLAKWLPREKSKTYPYTAHILATVLFPIPKKTEKSKHYQNMMYRKTIAEMNSALKTVEINMCGGQWAEIVPAHVPGRNFKIHRKAFLNESIRRGHAGELRKPNNEDRMECRRHFLEFIQDVKEGNASAKGANVVYPHEIITSILNINNEHASEIDMLTAQWNAIREGMKQGLRKSVPMCDFSGSMSGLPLLISFALGILISETNHPSFRDHILTFDSTPRWHSFKGMSLYQKVHSVNGIGEGLSTNFYGACRRILDRMIEHKVPLGEEPEDLIVLTDMGFDAAAKSGTGKWEGQLEQIRREFKDAGGWNPPRIVIWNLRAEFKDFHAKSDTDGVVMLSGWSPNILKALQTNGVQVKTPIEGMRAALDDARYDAVRNALLETV